MWDGDMEGGKTGKSRIHFGCRQGVVGDGNDVNLGPTTSTRV